MIPEFLNLHIAFASIGTLLAVISSWFYIVSIIRGKSFPSRATWIIWTLSATIVLISYYQIGARITLGLPLNFLITTLIVVFLSIKKGVGGWTVLDRTCFALVLLSLVVWYFTDSALTALLMNISIDIIGTIPTVKKVYFMPHSEDLLAWILGSLAGFFTMLAIVDITFGILIDPLYTFLINASVIAVMIVRRKTLKISKHE